MANVCNYEIHIKGSKKAALYFVDMTPSYCRDKEIIHEEGTDNEYIVWMIGDCKWDLDAYCEENPDAAAEVADDLERLTEEDIRNMDSGDYCSLCSKNRKCWALRFSPIHGAEIPNLISSTTI